MRADRADAVLSGRRLALALGAIGLLAFVFGRVASGSTYVVVLPLVTIASTVLVGVVVHPWATLPRRVFGSRAMVEIGKRSYGLYLWSWPISRMVGAYEGSLVRFVLAMALSVAASEACYRWIETPIRKGALGTWWRERDRADWRTVRGAGWDSYYGPTPDEHYGDIAVTVYDPNNTWVFDMNGSDEDVAGGEAVRFLLNEFFGASV